MQVQQTVTSTTVYARYGKIDVPNVADCDTDEFRSLHQYGEWAQSDVEFLLRLIGDGSVVIEASASIGTYTVPLARRAGESGVVHAFEPSHLARLLKLNVVRASAQSVAVYRAVLDAYVRPVMTDWRKYEVSQTELHVAEDVEETLASVGDVGNEISLPPSSTRMKQASEVSLNLDALDIAQCDLIRLACYGKEWRALAGACELLDRTRPYISLECHDVGSAWTATALLLSRGYRAWLYSWPAYNRDNFKHVESNIFGDAVQRRLFFLPQERGEGSLVITVSTMPFVKVNTLHELAMAYNAAETAH